MAFTTTSNFSGKAAGFYISAALKEAKSLEYLTSIENIKFKSNIQRMAGSGMVQDAACDFTDAGTLALTEKVLEPKNLMINIDLCKQTLLDSWEALQMRAGAGAPPPPHGLGKAFVLGVPALGVDPGEAIPVPVPSGCCPACALCAASIMGAWTSSYMRRRALKPPGRFSI